MRALVVIVLSSYAALAFADQSTTGSRIETRERAADVTEAGVPDGRAPGSPNDGFELAERIVAHVSSSKARDESLESLSRLLVGPGK